MCSRLRCVRDPLTAALPGERGVLQIRDSSAQLGAPGPALPAHLNLPRGVETPHDWSERYVALVAARMPREMIATIERFGLSVRMLAPLALSVYCWVALCIPRRCSKSGGNRSRALSRSPSPILTMSRQ